MQYQIWSHPCISMNFVSNAFFSIKHFSTCGDRFAYVSCLLLPRRFIIITFFVYHRLRIDDIRDFVGSLWCKNENEKLIGLYSWKTELPSGRSISFRNPLDLRLIREWYGTAQKLFGLLRIILSQIHWSDLILMIEMIK